jgi:hypothetical protein
MITQINITPIRNTTLNLVVTSAPVLSFLSLSRFIGIEHLTEQVKG